jgi:two-component system chemotaxis response regulator CheY
MRAILIVEDNADQRALTEMILGDEGYTVWSAANGAEALRLLAASPIDCIVTDLFMPEMDGVELIAEARSLYPSTKVIAVSGRELGRTNYLDAAAMIGADVTLKKPVSPEDLVAALRRLLGSDAP